MIMMKSKNKEEEEVSGTFTWVIENFSKLKNERHYSDVFTIAGFKWTILAWPKVNEVNSEMHFSMYLCVPSASILESGWTRFAHFSLSVLNQLDSNKTITRATKGSYKEFKEPTSEWGFNSFMLLSELYDETAGYLVNDKCIVEVKVHIPIYQRANGFAESALMEPEMKERGGQEPSHVHSVHTPESSPTPKTPSSEPLTPFQETSGPEQVCTKAIVESLPDPSLVKEVEEIPTKPTGELLEFRGLGLIERAFFPLLEEACSLHPLLIECVRKKNRKVIECALTALGGLLHFLKTTKVKDMNGDTFAHLQSLWEDVRMFRFDLAWLEPHVQSALGMKKFLERARRVKRLREDVEALDNEKKRRSAALAVTEAELEEAKRELAKEEEGFNEKDMDSELGCDQTIGS
ncbi:MATH domain and coiled-coil domain-containing protein At3g58370-like isoform X1 [Pyrus communis]|uniref:MATH domain and coiled-coil domain-containing protein At3g58370-like isoform X1 n=1 Tax=Pyrus communis TaxID=23211 RepID=UPI0035C1533D